MEQDILRRLNWLTSNILGPIILIIAAMAVTALLNKSGANPNNFLAWTLEKINHLVIMFSWSVAGVGCLIYLVRKFLGL